MGTTHAMAPEFFEDPIKVYSYEIDYYSFGILLFELYIGYNFYFLKNIKNIKNIRKPPFGYESENKMIIKDIKEGISDKQLEIIDNKSFKSLLKNILEVNCAIYFYLFFFVMKILLEKSRKTLRKSKWN